MPFCEMPFCDRRQFLTAITAAVAAQRSHAAQQEQSPGAKPRVYGLIGRMTAVAGQREALISILLEGTQTMPGCLSYIVARDAADENTVWITEVWDSKAHHDASLSLPAVKAAIAKARPLIASFGA